MSIYLSIWFEINFIKTKWNYHSRTHIYIYISIDQRNPYNSRKSRMNYARETQLFHDLFLVIERNNLFNFIATFEKRYKEFL